MLLAYQTEQEQELAKPSAQTEDDSGDGKPGEPAKPVAPPSRKGKG